MQITEAALPDSRFAEPRAHGRTDAGHCFALEEMVQRHGGALYRLALHLTCNESDARDLVQDTFERSLRRLPAQLPQDRVRSWLLVTLRNRFLDLRRSLHYRARVALEDTAAWAGPDEADPEPPWAKLDTTQVWRCADRLKPALRQVFVLRVRDRRSHAQIAAELSIPINTVGTRFYRALRHLRRMLEEELRHGGTGSVLARLS